MTDFAIGTQYKSGGKNVSVNTVTDILKTYNSKGELVQVRYVAEHQFAGQTVINRDVPTVSIQRGLIN